LLRLLHIRLPLLVASHAMGMLFAPDGRTALAGQHRVMGAMSAADLYRQTCGALDPYPQSPLPDEDQLKKLHDFHHIVSSLGDHPALQRLTGQVLTLTFALPPALPAMGTIRVLPAWVAPSGTPTVHYSPSTAYTLQGTAFEAQPRPTFSDARGGFLRVDDPNLFQVIQLESVGSLMKLANAGANWLAMDSEGFPASAAEDTAALPALRNGGVSLVRTTMEDYLDQVFAQSAALQAALAGQDGSPAPAGATGTVTLYANDLVRGYRADVFDQQAGRWFSLHQTYTTYHFDRNPRLDTSGAGIASEGFTQHVATKAAGDESGTGATRHSPSLFTWDGWSLSAARPGKVLDTAYDAQNPVTAPRNDSRTMANFQTTRRAVPGTLPRLRYGRSYQLRVRTVDLAGDSAVEPGDAAFQKTPGEVTAPFVYQRFHPVSHPATILCADPG
jgi:hypothetical protein